MIGEVYLKFNLISIKIDVLRFLGDICELKFCIKNELNDGACDIKIKSLGLPGVIWGGGGICQIERLLKSPLSQDRPVRINLKWLDS